MQVIVQIDPCCAGVTQHDGLLQRCAVDQHQVQLLLLSIQALEGELFWTGPLHACEVDILADWNPADILAVGRDQSESSCHVCLTSGRISLLDHISALGLHFESPHQRHLSLVVLLERDRAVIGGPPVAARTIHFFLGDELGFAVVNRPAAVAGQLVARVVGKIDQPQILIANERNETAFWRDAWIDCGAAGIESTQWRGAPAIASARHQTCVEIEQIEFFAQGEQQTLAIRRPLVVEDATEVRRACALATSTLFVADCFTLRRDVVGVHQQACRTVLDVVFPKVEPVLIVGLSTQETHPRTIRRNLQRARRWPAQTAAFKYSLDRQLLGHQRNRKKGKSRDQQGREVRKAHDNSWIKAAIIARVGLAAQSGSDFPALCGRRRNAWQVRR